MSIEDQITAIRQANMHLIMVRGASTGWLRALGQAADAYEEGNKIPVNLWTVFEDADKAFNDISQVVEKINAALNGELK